MIYFIIIYKTKSNWLKVEGYCTNVETYDLQKTVRRQLLMEERKK